ncbi:MAG: hypothetical protein ACM3SS_00740, partial [Rhodospirillaceae bacterium]
YTDKHVGGVESGDWYFVSGEAAMQAINEALGVKMTRKAFACLMRRHMDAGHFKGRITPDKLYHGTRGYRVFHDAAAVDV